MLQLLVVRKSKADIGVKIREYHEYPIQYEYPILLCAFINEFVC